MVVLCPPQRAMAAWLNGSIEATDTAGLIDGQSFIFINILFLCFFRVMVRVSIPVNVNINYIFILIF